MHGTSPLAHALAADDSLRVGASLDDDDDAWPRCWPLLRFHWQPSTGAIRSPDAATWAQYRRDCFSERTHFCRPPIWGSEEPWRLNVHNAIWKCDASQANVSGAKGPRCPATAEAKHKS